MDISKLTLQLNNFGKDKTIPKQILDIRYNARIYQDFRQSLSKFIQQKKKYNKTNFDQNLMAFALLCAGEFKEPEFAEKINKVFDINDEKFSFERKPMLCPLLVFAKGILVDLFFYYKYQGKVINGIHTKMAPLLWVFEPFEVVKNKFSGHDFEYYVPSDIDLFFENLFGKDWRTPIPVWDSLVKCPNLAMSLQKAVFFYGVQRFYKALENHKYLKAADYYDLLSNRWKYPFSAEMKSHIENLLQQLKTEFESKQKK